MAFYILFMACYPCRDNEECHDEKTACAEQIVIAGHPHGAHEGELCSPFCACSCCSIVSLPKYFTFVFPVPERIEYDPFNRPYNASSFSYSIWQPPKLS